MSNKTLFRSFFDTTTMSKIPDTYIDQEIWAEFAAKDIDEAGKDAFVAYLSQVGKLQQQPIFTKVRLTRIVSMEGPPQVKIYMPLDDPDMQRVCRSCGCSQEFCEQCIKRSGHPCSWVEADLCSVCDEILNKKVRKK